MTGREFIFSNKSSLRLQRHLLFWFIWWIYFGFLHAFQPFNNKIAPFERLGFTIPESILLLVPQMVLVYYMLYVVCTRFLLKNKYLLAVLWTIPGWFISVAVNMYMINHVNGPVLSYILPAELLVGTQRPAHSSFYMAFMNAAKGAFTVAGMAVALKFIQHWYLKEQRNAQLLKENTEAQLQLLTAQVHPHFLFNTLNNIYSQTQTESPKGSKMIMELSDLLRYILAEGAKPLVPLRKELAMIKNYMDLEKIRYGNKLDLHVALPQNTSGYEIAPLLLLPFVENCFKHGASKFLNAPWVNLKIEVAGRTLTMKLMNGKEVGHAHAGPKSGTGINNVRRRIELLYPDRHELEIIDEPEVFIVNLKLLLNNAEDSLVTSKTSQRPVYA